MKKVFGTLAVILLICAAGVGAFAFGRYYVFHNEHSTLSALVSDDTHHWYVCEDCDEKVDKKEHTQNVTSSGDSVWVNDEGYHWAVCKDCGHQMGEKIAHSVKCDTNDQVVYVSDSNNHWTVCKDCGYEIVKEEHSMVETLIVEASHGEDGVVQQKCEDCGYITQESVAIESTITEEEWAEILETGNRDNVQMTYIQTVDGFVAYARTMVKDGDKQAVYFDGKLKGIIAIVDGQYYAYSQSGDVWSKNQVTEDAYRGETINSFFDEALSVVEYSDLEYNEELDAYEIVVSLPDPGEVFMQFYFKDGEMTQMVFVNNEQGIVVMLGYENIAVEVPEI